MTDITARRFDWRPAHDPRSRGYAVAEKVTGALATREWPCTVYLDQGAEGSCVGHAWAHDLAAEPTVIPADGERAMWIYRTAQTLDDWAGEDYEGTSVLAGAKASVAGGWVREYRWAFGVDDVLAALSEVGPVVLGVSWHEQMTDTDPDGYIHPTGQVVGGHAILAVGLDVDERSVTLHNSWGRSWGQAGRCRVTWDDLAALLDQAGEACVPTDMASAPAPGA